jgi:hypothetical protein
MPTPTSDLSLERWSLRLAWLALAGLLLLGIPLFLCMPVWPDVTHYDLCARNILRGGVHYRDLADFNLPGMVWVHAGIRSLLGWRIETLRAIDLLVVAANVWLLVRWVGLLGARADVRVWTAVLLFLFYFSTTEWAHCQRDTWMLLPCLVALELRRRQVGRVAAGGSLGSIALGAVAEGLCWGVAVWLKPFVVFPAFFSWLASVVWVCRSSGRGRVGSLVADAASLLLGGLLAGGLGLAALEWSGSLPYFWQTLFHGNQGYYAKLKAIGVLERLGYMITLLPPWGGVYLLALPAAVAALVTGFSARSPLVATSGLDSAPRGASAVEASERSPAHVLLAAFFLGWFFQVTFVQMPHQYVLVPALTLSLAVAVGLSWPPRLETIRFVILAAVLVLAVLVHPLLRQDRLALWGRCWVEGGSPDLRNRLSLTGMRWTPDWVSLEQVADYLRGQELQDGELVCFNGTATSLYIDLDLRCPTRAPHFDHVMLTPYEYEPLRQELNAAPRRFVVSDISCLYWEPSPGEEEQPPDELALPPAVPKKWAQRFPWCEPVVFRAGRYRVHRVTGPVKELRSSIESFLTSPPDEKEDGP